MEDMLEKIRKIEALINGAQTTGEKNAAISAKDRILNKYPELKVQSNTEEFSLRTPDTWHKKLLLAICRKYGLNPFRYKRQKYTTVMVNVNEAFLKKVVWPEYLEFSAHLEELVDSVTDDLINTIHKHADEDIIQGDLK